MRAGNRNQWVRVLATKPEDLSSLPESHMVEGELTHKLSFALLMGTVTHLFAGPLVSVHLHHALAEDVKGVFFLLRPISSQALSF